MRKKCLRHDEFILQVEYDTLLNWPWTNEYILTLESPEKIALGVLNSVFDTKWDYQPQKAEKCRFSKFIYQVVHDTLPNWPWTNEYILTLKSPEKLTLGVLNLVFDTKSDYQHQKAEKCRFSKFIYQVVHDTLPNLPWTNEYILTLESLEKVALGVLNSIIDTK